MRCSSESRSRRPPLTVVLRFPARGKRIVADFERGRRDHTRTTASTDVRQHKPGHHVLAHPLRRLPSRRHARLRNRRRHRLRRGPPASRRSARAAGAEREAPDPTRLRRGRVPDGARPLPAAAAVGSVARCVRILDPRPAWPARRAAHGCGCRGRLALQRTPRSCRVACNRRSGAPSLAVRAPVCDARGSGCVRHRAHAAGRRGEGVARGSTPHGPRPRRRTPEGACISGEALRSSRYEIAAAIEPRGDRK